MIVRFLLSPVVLVLVSVAFLVIAVKKTIEFVRFGGEFVIYQSQERKTIMDIYNLLKKQND